MLIAIVTFAPLVVIIIAFQVVVLALVTRVCGHGDLTYGGKQVVVVVVLDFS